MFTPESRIHWKKCGSRSRGEHQCCSGTGFLESDPEEL